MPSPSRINVHPVSNEARKRVIVWYCQCWDSCSEHLPPARNSRTPILIHTFLCVAALAAVVVAGSLICMICWCLLLQREPSCVCDPHLMTLCVCVCVCVCVLACYHRSCIRNMRAPGKIDQAEERINTKSKTKPGIYRKTCTAGIFFRWQELCCCRWLLPFLGYMITETRCGSALASTNFFSKFFRFVLTFCHLKMFASDRREWQKKERLDTGTTPVSKILRTTGILLW